MSLCCTRKMLNVYFLTFLLSYFLTFSAKYSQILSEF